MMSGLPGGCKTDKCANWIVSSWPPENIEMLEYQWSVAIPYWEKTAKIAEECGIEKIALENHAYQLVYNVDTLFRLRRAETYHMEYGYSCMGYEISGALGVKLAVGDREVYALVGDGSFLMLHSELITSLQENKKINVLLFDNGGFGCINNLQVSQGNETLVTEFRYREESGKHDGKFMKIDYAKCAEGYGAKSYRATTEEELISALKDAEKQEISTFIDIKVLPKTMTAGYGSWWRVGAPEISSKDKVKEAYSEMKENVKKAYKY